MSDRHGVSVSGSATLTPEQKVVKLEKRIAALEGALLEVNEWLVDTDQWRMDVNGFLDHISDRINESGIEQ